MIWSATAYHDMYHASLKMFTNRFVQSGTQAVTTNSYGRAPGDGFNTPEIAQHRETAAMLAREVVDRQSGVAFVCGSLGPW
jgi:methionine synthase I (cobalamin-dependent)